MLSKINNITDFIMRYSTYSNKEKLKEFIKQHIFYKTCLDVRNDFDEIIGFARWNILDEGKTMLVLDVIVREDYRYTDLIFKMFQKEMKRYPYVSFIEFEKGYDDGLSNKPKKRYEIKKMIRRFKNVQKFNQVNV